MRILYTKKYIYSIKKYYTIQYVKLNQILSSLTLYGPRFFTEQASFTFLPAGTVIFSIISVNSGSSATTETERMKQNNITFGFLLSEN